MCTYVPRTHTHTHLYVQVFTLPELTAIADIISKQPQRVIVIADEVYEHLTYDGAIHTHFANIPGM